MGQLLLPDNLPNIAVASTTSVTLAANANGQTTTVTIGGQQYSLSSTLTLATGTTGANGLDTGSLGAIQLWYVYAIANSSTFTPALIASQTGPASGPSFANAAGYFSAYKLVGAFYTNGSSQVGSAVAIVGKATTDLMTYTPSTTGFGTISGGNFFWGRDGDSLYVEATFTSGTTTGVAASVGFPSGLAVNTNKTVTGSVYNTFAFNQSTTKDFVMYFTSTGNAFAFGHGNLNTANGTDFGAGPSTVSFSARVPISGWTNTLL